VHRQQVTVEDADVLHAHAVYAQQIVGLGVEEGRVDVAGLLDVLFGKNRRTGSDPADDGQAGFFGLGFQARDADAAGSARRHFDRALAGKGLEVLLGGIGRLEAQLLSNLGAGRREAVVFQAALDERENFGLAWRQFQHGERSVFLYSDWDYIQYWMRCKPKPAINSSNGACSHPPGVFKWRPTGHRALTETGLKRMFQTPV